jgi:pimeloyl-ACP methyl ester carboxylesterase
MTSFSSFGRSNISVAEINSADLEYIDIGEGEFNIVIESGVGMGVNYWKPLLRDLQELQHRIIIYSRAGIGKSTDSTDVSLKSSNKRLNDLLTSLKVKNDIILVGHSYGGLHVREYAVSFSDQVSGMVLLDPSHELFSNKLKKLNNDWAENDDKKLNAIMAGNREWAVLQSEYKKGMLSDGGTITTIPTLVVTSSKNGESDWWIGHSSEGKKVWRNLHSSLIRNNPNSIHIISDAVGHNIPLEQPDLVISSINQLIMSVKAYNKALNTDS